jgi:type I restriction enzyme S subunit
MNTLLPPDWRVVYPEDIVSGERSIVSGPFGSNIGKRFFVESGIPVIRGNNLTLGIKRFVDEGFVFLTEEKAKQFKNCQAVAGDIVFTAAGTLGQVGLIPQKAKFPVYIISNKQLRVRPDPRIALSGYLYYWFSSEGVRNHIIGLNTGSSVPLITLGKLRSVPINLPPLPTQRKIATILLAYDDLIENTLRRIKVLEEMAQNLYREWFVKFRFPDHQHARFTDSSLGRIPEGWEVKRLGEILELNYGKALKQGNRHGGNVPVYGSSGVIGYHDTRLVNGPGIIIGRKGNVGSVFWSDEDFYPIDTAYFVTSKLPLRFLFYDLQTKNFLNNDAAVPGLNRNQAYSLEMVKPPEDILTRFCQFAEDFERQAAVLRLQNVNLHRTRDLLLSKLISGEVDVSALDIAVPEEAA